MTSGDAELNKTERALLEKFEPKMPQSSLLWSAVVEVGQTVDLGPSPKGHRYMVPILGGSFVGADAGLGLSGAVLAGGADRQVLRSDGVKELEAIYEMETQAGIILSIRNCVTVDTKRTPKPYAMSVIEVTAPEGPLDWLNKRMIVGTLQSARPAQPYVIIRAWLVDC